MIINKHEKLQGSHILFTKFMKKHVNYSIGAETYDILIQKIIKCHLQYLYLVLIKIN